MASVPAGCIPAGAVASLELAVVVSLDVSLEVEPGPFSTIALAIEDESSCKQPVSSPRLAKQIIASNINPKFRVE
jgi:hypothetical protein